MKFYLYLDNGDIEYDADSPEEKNKVQHNHLATSVNCLWYEIATEVLLNALILTFIIIIHFI